MPASSIRRSRRSESNGIDSASERFAAVSMMEAPHSKVR
jgi:hypothetical protein